MQNIPATGFDFWSDPLYSVNGYTKHTSHLIHRFTLLSSHSIPSGMHQVSYSEDQGAIPEVRSGPWFMIGSFASSNYLSLRVTNSLLLSNVLVYLHQLKKKNQALSYDKPNFCAYLNNYVDQENKKAYKMIKYRIKGVGLLNSHLTTLHHWLSFKGKSRCPLIHLL